MSDEPSEGHPGAAEPGADPAWPGPVAATEKAPPPRPEPRPAPPPAVVPGGRVANPVALASLAVGVVALVGGILPPTAPFGAALGILAVALGGTGIYKARQGGATGRGVAIIGLIAGLFGLAAACFWLALSTAVRGTAGPAPDLAQEAREEIGRIGPTVPIDALGIGTCFQDPVGGAEVNEVPVVACSQPHANEVYAILVVDGAPGAPYPLVQQLRAVADGECQAEPFDAYIGEHYLISSLDSVAYYPSQARWAAGDRRIVCVVSDPVGQVTASLRGTGEVLPPQGPLQPPPRPTVTPLPLPPPPTG